MVKKYKVRFIKDEDFPASAGEFFKQKGYVFEDIKTYKKKVGKDDNKFPDENVIKVATAENCILLSKDHDYEHNIYLFELIKNSPGVVVWIIPNPSKKNIIHLATRTIKEINRRKIDGQILKISTNSTRRITPI